MSANPNANYPADIADDVATLPWRGPAARAPADHAKRVYDSIADLAPSPANPTPLVRVSPRVNSRTDVDLYLKLEAMNPFGSIKDRTARFMLDGLDLKEGEVVVEPTAGNTGIALAALANARNRPVEIVVPDGTPEEKKALLRFLGVELTEVEDEVCPLFPTEGARGVVKSMVESPAFAGRYVSPNQYESLLNVEAHYRTTGPEIWRQTDGNIDYFFAGIGTGGTLTGVGRYLKERKPQVQVIGVEPAGRQHRLSGLKRVTGLPDEHFPKLLDRSILDDIVSVTDADAFGTGVQLAQSDGIMVGPTTGAVVHAAITHTRDNALAVAISGDGAVKYLSEYAEFMASG